MRRSREQVGEVGDALRFLDVMKQSHAEATERNAQELQVGG